MHVTHRGAFGHLHECGDLGVAELLNGSQQQARAGVVAELVEGANSSSSNAAWSSRISPDARAIGHGIGACAAWYSIWPSTAGSAGKVLRWWFLAAVVEGATANDLGEPRARNWYPG